MGTAFPIGADFTRTSTAREFSLGECGMGDDGSQYIYVKSSASTISAYNAVGFNLSCKALRLTKALADAGRRIGFPQATIPVAEHGWVCVRSGGDDVKVKVLASAEPNVRLYTTGTAGSLDDTSASQTGVFGVVIEQTAGASAGGGNGLTIRARIEYPHAEATA